MRDLFFFSVIGALTFLDHLISSLETKTAKILILFFGGHLLKALTYLPDHLSSSLETKTTVQALCSSTVKVFLLYFFILVFINLIKKLSPLLDHLSSFLSGKLINSL